MENEPSNQVVRVHRRQFVIGPSEFLARSDWRSLKVGSDLLLSTDPDLRVNTTTDLDGIQWFLLGLAVDIRPEFSFPLEEIERRRTKEIQELYEGWSGRWVLVGGGYLHPDGAAMLGCYYGKSDSGESWTSSSPSLIRRVLRVESTAGGLSGSLENAWQPLPDATVTGGVRGISWYPPPHSGITGVSRLLPSQILDLHKASPKPRPLVMSLNGSHTDQDLYRELSISVSTAIKRFAALSAPQSLTLLLSGGKDSRLLLSAATSASVPLQTFTRIHRRASLADRKLPQRLAGIAGYPHTKHYQRYEIPGRRQAILEHAGYNVSWLSAEEFLRGGSDPLRGIALAGFCGELGRDRLIPATTAEEATGEMIANYYLEGDSLGLVAAFDAWLEWRRDYHDPYLDLCDYFFLEQRTGGRKGAKEQIFDLFPVERVPPLNCARIFALICNLSLKAKLGALWIPEIIKSATPELLRYPMNPPDSYFGFIHAKLLNFNLYQKRLKFLRRFNSR